MSWMLIVLAVAGTITRVLAGASDGGVSIAPSVNVATGTTINDTWVNLSPSRIPAQSATAYRHPAVPAAELHDDTATRPHRSPITTAPLRRLGVPPAWIIAALHAALSHPLPRGVRRLTGSARILLERALAHRPATPSPSRSTAAPHRTLERQPPCVHTCHPAPGKTTSGSWPSPPQSSSCSSSSRSPRRSRGPRPVRMNRPVGAPRRLSLTAGRMKW